METGDRGTILAVLNVSYPLGSPTCSTYNNAAVAQLDRVPVYEAGCQEFESLQPRQF